MFKISDIQLEVKSATLEAFIDNDDRIMEWGIAITASSANRDDLQWQVKLSSDTLFSTTITQLKYWKDIAGINFSWDKPLDEDEEAHGSMYVCQHEPVYSCSGELYLNNENTICIRWNGKCDIHWNKHYNQNLDFLVETPITFKGIWFGKDIEADCREVLSQYITQENFDYIIERYVSLMTPSCNLRHSALKLERNNGI